MPRHAETKSLPYTPEQMFDLVADVARYAEFLPWVSAVRVRSDSPTELVADLVVGFKGLRETFTSKVTKSQPHSIHVDYIDGPLKHLSNDWTFRAAPGGCEVDFAVDFAFKNRMFELLAGQLFGSALMRMTSAFEARAAQLYGSGTSDSRGSKRSSAHKAA